MGDEEPSLFAPAQSFDDYRRMNDQARPASSPLNLDLRGLRCPGPTRRLSFALDQAAPGQRLQVFASDGLACIDIPHLIAARGDKLIRQETRTRHYVFLVEKQ